MKKYIYTIAFLLLKSVIFAQTPELSFQLIAPEEGFAYPMIRGFAQDKEGFLWFGNLNCVYRYDGYTLKPYPFGPSQNSTSALVNVIYEDSKNNLWIGTVNGLNKLDRQTGKFTQYVSDSTSHFFKNYVWSILEDSRKQIWIGAMGLYNFDQNTGKLSGVSVPPDLEILNRVAFQSMEEDKYGNLWFGTSIGVVKYEYNNRKFIPIIIDPETDKLSAKNWNTGNYATPSIIKDEDGIIWAGTYGCGLIKIDPSTGVIEKLPVTDSRTLSQCPILSIAAENKDELWLGTYVGLILFDKKSGKIKIHSRYNENAADGLSDERIISIIRDRSGTLWAGTLNGGLNKLNRTTIPFHKIIKKSWMRDITISILPIVQDFFVSKSGSLFTGTDSGIDEITPGLDSMITRPPFKGINILFEDSKGNQWISLRQTSGGGMLIKNKKGDLLPVLDSVGQRFEKEIHFIYESSLGRYFFSADFYLYEVDTETRRSRFVYQTPARIFSIADDTEGNLMLGTLLAGLHIFNPLTGLAEAVFNRIENDPTSIVDNNITTTFIDSRGRVWVTSPAGLCRYDPSVRKFTRYTDRLNSAFACITEDNSGKLWLGTWNGVTSFNPETAEFRNYDYSYGLINNFHYACGKSGNLIFFKTKSGISWFNPDDISDNKFLPPVKITEFKVFDKSSTVSDEIVLSHDENYISFEFAALSFMNPEKNQYAYKMEGVDKDWIYSKDRRYAAYTDLDPGTYTFYVKASNNDGVWNEKGTSVLIIINPPWWRTYWAFGLYALLAFLLLYAWRRYDLKRQNLKYQLQTEHEYSSKLQEISDMKTRFFTNISHEFRTPLTLILGPSDKLLSGEYHPSYVQKQVSIIKRNALRLLGLINQLLDISKLDDSKLKLKVSCGNVVSYIKGIVMIFESFAESKDITLSVEPEREGIQGYFDREVLEKVLINLISNAFKFTPAGGKISVSVSEYNETVTMKVSDTGVGIPEAEISKLFDRFYQVDSSQTREYEGTGIGLALTKELVELHKGRISVKSKPGILTEFTVELPVGKSSFDDEQILEKAQEYSESNLSTLSDLVKANLTDSVSHSPAADIPYENNTQAEAERMILLIVEDNKDVREYIKDELEREFRIEEASNGEQGVRKAQMIIPDLIIGDLMMPKMDGLAMTRIIKNDEKTNHIPVILLTAKSDQESKYEGLEAGADDYLVKPFDIRELNIRIQNLINTRKKLQERYSAGPILLPPAPDHKDQLSMVNEQFMSRVNEIVKKHIAEEGFSVEDFCLELGMSRTHLHRKLTAIAGKSVSRYVRTFRLNIAKEMIREQKGNISEIAYSVGFSSPIYFSRCFREEFGYTPSEVAN